MRRLLKILKWTGIILLTLIIATTITVMARQNLKYDAPYPNIKSSNDSTMILRGKELVFGAGHCVTCHTTVNADSVLALGQEVLLTGGFLFDFPIGKIYSKNLTPDSLTGIGRYTDAQLARSLRYGVATDGKALFPFMEFHHTSDEDLTAIFSYLRSQKPVKNEIPEATYNVIGKVVKAFFLKPIGPRNDIPVSVKKDSTAEYGKYLATSVANCNGCHSVRDPLSGGYKGELFSGGMDIDGFITPNLTTHESGRISGWSQDIFINRFRQGKLNPKSPMPWNSFKRMSDDDLKAIYKYLKTLKPVPTGK
jgi:mono/diheme cytochrome c family protein